MRVKSYLEGAWQDGDSEESQIVNPLNGDVVATVSAQGLNIKAALSYAREVGGPALRALGFSERAGLLRAIAGVLVENRDRYNELALQTGGNTVLDAALDVDGGIGTLKYYASFAKKLGNETYIVEGPAEQITRDAGFKAIHILTPLQGVAVHINAFNFPSWGLWEKAAVSILSGVPLLAKPASATCLLSYEMFKDVIAANVVPGGVLSLLCGGGRDLMDHVGRSDVVAFTGSAETANMLRSNANVISKNVRFAVEADSLNSCFLGPDVTPASPEFDLFIKEVSREMTVKAGQKCTAVRRIIVPSSQKEAVIAALSARLAGTKVGDPRNETVRMGPLVSKAQKQAALDGLKVLSLETRVAFGDGELSLVDAKADEGYFISPTLLVCDTPLECTKVHEVEVFGPVATVMPYETPQDAFRLGALGGGSLVCSVFSGDEEFAHSAALNLAPNHGRVLIVNEAVAKGHSGHGVVMPQCIHGGPGRAGGGEELGGLRGLQFYHQRSAIQASEERISKLLKNGQSLG